MGFSIILFRCLLIGFDGYSTMAVRLVALFVNVKILYIAAFRVLVSFNRLELLWNRRLRRTRSSRFSSRHYLCFHIPLLVEGLSNSSYCNPMEDALFLGKKGSDNAIAARSSRQASTVW